MRIVELVRARAGCNRVRALVKVVKVVAAAAKVAALVVNAGHARLSRCRLISMV